MGEKEGPFGFDLNGIAGLVTLRSFFHITFFLYLATFVITFTLSDRWGFYQFSAGINFCFYLLMVVSAIRSGFLRELFSKGKGWTLFILFAVPLTLQLFLLFQSPSFSQDLFRLVFRGEAIADGSVPYEDFEVNKPPLYIWMVGAVSHTLGPTTLAFRSVFIISNSLIAPLIYIIGKEVHRGADPDEGWKTMVYPAAAFAYSLWPVGMIESGIAGHFDPIVVVVVLLSLLALRRNSHLVSGIFLGAGFALKMFPLFIAPFFFLSIKKWKDRGLLILGFFIVPLVSSFPFLIKDPSGVLGYIFYQSSDWGVSLSLRFVIDQILSSIGIPVVLSFILSLLLLALGIFALMAMASGRIRKVSLERTLLVLFITLAWIAGGYYTIILFSGSTSSVELLIGLSVIVVLVILTGFAIWNIFRNEENDEQILEKKNRILDWNMDPSKIPLYSTLALVLLLLVSAQFHPWYLIWAAPFAFLSSPRVGWTYMILSGPLHFLIYPPWDMGSFF